MAAFTQIETEAMNRFMMFERSKQRMSLFLFPCKSSLLPSHWRPPLHAREMWVAELLKE